MSVRITGDREVINMLRRLGIEIVPRVIDPYSREYCQELVSRMKPRMHSRSGRMINSTGVGRINNGWAAIIGVSYGMEENARPGSKLSKQGTGQGTPHQFVEPSIREVESTSNTKLVRMLDAFISSL